MRTPNPVATSVDTATVSTASSEAGERAKKERDWPINKALIACAAGMLIFGGTSAFAADLGVAVAATPPASPSPTTTFGIEVDPEFLALAKSAAQPAGTLADAYLKATLSHTFAGLWVVSGFFQPQADIQTNGGDKHRYYAEADLGYKIKLNSFTLTPTVGIGDVWGDTNITKANPSALYYALYLAGDWKLSSKWTWNVFNARYRDAFNYTWITPKVTTGLTYNIDSHDVVYANVGYSWKDTGAGLKADKTSFALGYKYAW